MSDSFSTNSRHWLSAGLVLLAIYLGGFGLIRMNCDFMINGIGADIRSLPKPLRHSQSNWDKPFARLVVEAYRPLFWADSKLTGRLYVSDPSAGGLIFWP